MKEALLRAKRLIAEEEEEEEDNDKKEASLKGGRQ